MITGILAADKPIAWTSHDVVARVRRTLGQKQVGHAGTLDPLATGVLVLVLGGATRLSPYLMGSPKVYCAEIGLGATTVTDDAEAPLQRWRDPSGVDQKALETALQGFVGEIEQVPPAYAAVKQDGKKLYQLVRKGIEVRPEPRRVTVHDLQVVRWRPPRLTLQVRCSAGTYIRSLARDLGGVLGCGGYLHGLRRMASGRIPLSWCAPPRVLSEREELLRYLLPPDIAVAHMSAVVLHGADLRRLRQGQALDQPGLPWGEVRIYGPSGALEALARADNGAIRPFRVFPEGDADAAGR